MNNYLGRRRNGLCRDRFIVAGVCASAGCASDAPHRLCADQPERMKRVQWSIKDLTNIESGHGVYFLRTNVPTKSATEIYRALHYTEAPFKKLKICRTQPPPD